MAKQSVPKSMKSNSNDSNAGHGVNDNINAVSGEELSLLYAVNRDVPFRIQARLSAGMSFAFLMDRVVHEKNIAGIEFVNPENYVVHMGTGKVSLRQPMSKGPLHLQCLPYMAPEFHESAHNDEKILDESFYNGLIRHFTAVCEYRILFLEDPFDSDETLVRFPMLTTKTAAHIYGRNAHFVQNGEQENQRGKIWEQYPVFLRDAFSHAFSAGLTVPEERFSPEKWLYILRCLRDCMVVADKQFRFRDPETEDNTANSVLWMLIEAKEGKQYCIPIVENKAVYQYHSCQDFDFHGMKDDNIRIGGIRKGKDDYYYLENLSNESWEVEDPARHIKKALFKGESYYLEPGLILRMQRGGHATISNSLPERIFHK